MLNLLKSVAIQDQTVTTNVCTLVNIMEGVDGSSTFGYSLTPTAVQVNDNQTQQYKHDHLFDIRTLTDTADTTKLSVISALNREVKVTGYSPNGFFAIDEPAQLVYHDQFDSVLSDRILVSITGVNGYGGTAPGKKLPVYAGDNLLAIYDVLSGSASYLNGFDAGDSGTVTGGSVAIAPGDQAISRSILFPFEGISLTASVDHVGTSGAIDIEYLLAGGGVISTSQTTGNTGRLIVTGTTPSGTVLVRVAFTGGTGSSFSNPALKLEGSTFTL